MDFNTRIRAFVELGKKIDEALDREEGKYEGLSSKQINLLLSIKKAGFKNGWFEERNVKSALKGIALMLEEEGLIDWSSNYVDLLSVKNSPKKVLVVMAGNIPAVGFHDFLSVLISGNDVYGKLSSDDEELMPAIAELLFEIEPAFAEKVFFLKETFKGFDAVIATGSDNSARYFDYYFGKYPNIIRKSRVSVGVIDGNETDDDFAMLADDVFNYFGLGCRNVSKLLVPKGFDMPKLMDGFAEKAKKLDNSKYINNLDYNKSIYLINKVPFLDGGTYLVKKDEGIHSPISVLFYQEYETSDDLDKYLALNQNSIQCVVDKKGKYDGVSFGQAQFPSVQDYADKVDTLEFLLGL